jgi:hypothetical protein
MIHYSVMNLRILRRPLISASTSHIMIANETRSIICDEPVTIAHLS